MKSEFILISGPKKTGSSMLRQMLDGLPESIMIPGEINARGFWYLRKYSSSKQLAADYLLSNRNTFLKSIQKQYSLHLNPSSAKAIEEKDIPPSLMDAIPLKEGEILGWTQEEISNRFSFPRYYESLFEELRKENKKAEDLVWIEAKALLKGIGKETLDLRRILAKEVTTDLRHIPSLFKNFPKFKLIVIVRDPRATLLSRMSSDKKDYSFSTNVKRKFKILKACNRIALDALKLQKDMGKDHVMVLKYEDVVIGNNQVYKELSNFLSLDLNQEMLKPSILGYETEVTTSTKRYDRNKKDVGVFSSSIDKWKKSLSGLDIFLSEAVCYDFLSQRSYQYEFHYNVLLVRAARIILSLFGNLKGSL